MITREIKEAIRAFERIPPDSQRAVLFFLLDALEEDRPGFVEEFPELLDNLYGTGSTKSYRETSLEDDYNALSPGSRETLLDVAFFLRQKEDLGALLQMARGARERLVAFSPRKARNGIR